MDPILGLMVVMLFLKMLAEDAYSGVTGKPNPRLARRVVRQRSRAHNRIWRAVVDYLGDLAEDASKEATAARRRRLEVRQRERELAELLAEEENAEREQLRPHHFVSKGGPLCGYTYGTAFSFGCGHPEHDPIHIAEEENTEHIDQTGECRHCGEPIEHVAGIRNPFWRHVGPIPDPPHAAEPRPIPSNVIPLFQPLKAPTTKENDMTTTAVNGEVTGLTQAIAYAEALAGFAAEHGQAGNEGYIGVLQNAKVQGEGLASAHEMQEAFANAAAAAERHKAHLEAQTGVQEAYGANPDAGDKDFQQSGQ